MPFSKKYLGKKKLTANAVSPPKIQEIKAN